MIVDLIKSYTAETTTVTAFSVGTFSIDCQLEESHESNLVTTENAMESGALSTDHSYLEPKRYAVRGIMVSYEPFNMVQDIAGDKYSFVKSLPLPIGIAGKLGQIEATANRYASTVLQAIDKVQKAANVLAPWLPDSLGWLGDEAPTNNRFEKVYGDLLSIQKSGEMLTVSSGLMTYQNMKLINVIANKGTDDSVELALTFKENHVVETRTVQGLVVNVPTAQKATTSTSKVEGEKKTGRAADQAAKPKAKGKTQPTKQTETKKSVARSIGDVIRGGGLF